MLECETSRYLLNHWFKTDHMIKDAQTGKAYQFRYHWAQREAIESIIYLHELRKIGNVASLLTEFGGESLMTLLWALCPKKPVVEVLL